MTQQSANPEWSLLNWLLPPDVLRGVAPVTALVVLPQNEVVLVASREGVMAFRVCAVREEALKMEEEEKTRYLQDEVSPLDRLLK